MSAQLSEAPNDLSVGEPVGAGPALWSPGCRTWRSKVQSTRPSGRARFRILWSATPITKRFCD